MDYNKNDDIFKNETESKVQKIEDELNKQRNNWASKLEDLINKIKSVDQLSDAQVLMLSYRQMIVDLLTQYSIKTRKLESKYISLYKRKFISYYNYDYRINDKYKDNMVKADLSQYKMQINLLESQIEFFRESIRTLDNMGFAIKNRLQMEQI